MDTQVQRLVQELALAPHPEGGYYRETFRSDRRVGGLEYAPGATRSASTAIYFLLPAGAFSAMHRVRADEVWHFYDGDPLELHRLYADGRHETVRLGRDWSAGERPQQVVPADCWQGARVIGTRYALVGCTVAPGFEFEDFELPSRADLAARFPEHAMWLRSLTRDSP